MLILEGAGWRPHEGLAVPANITLLFLPTYSRPQHRRLASRRALRRGVNCTAINQRGAAVIYGTVEGQAQTEKISRQRVAVPEVALLDKGRRRPEQDGHD